MELTYLYDGAVYTAAESNSTVEIKSTEANNRIVVTVHANEDVKLLGALNPVPYTYHKADLIFANGYQSWTDTKEFMVSEVLNNIYKRPKFIVNMFAFDKYGDAPFKKYKKHVIHGFDYSYVRGEKPVIVVNHNEKNAFLIINHDHKNNEMIMESDLGITLKKDSEFVIFDYSMEYGDVDTLVAKYFPKKMTEENVFGYTSWYNHYQNITESIIMDNLDHIDPRFNLFQIDDGYEQFVGDWLKVDKNKFPNGMEGICKKILEKNITAGIWLAPFVAEEKSDLFREKKDWFAKDKEGNPIKTGCNWSGFYVLDIYNPEARAYITECLRHYQDMGFRLFKLDFLYSVNMIEREDKTRAQISSDAYDIITEALDQSKVLGCGAMLSTAKDRFTYMRIGCDVSLKFDDVAYMRLFHRERISTKVTLQNTIYRSIFARSLFMNDPDVFLLRDDNIELSAEQKVALATINALFGNVLMTSDNPGDYNDEKKKLLDTVLDINRNATNKKYKREGQYILLSYDLNGKTVSHRYDTKRGVFND